MKTTKFWIHYLAIFGLALVLFLGCKKSSDDNNNPPASTTVTDADGNVYHTVTIGTQVWLLENLKTTKYNDGSSIPLVTDNVTWRGLSTPAFCWYNNDETTYKNTYGALYNWFTVNTGKLAPQGWHVPTKDDWTVLLNYLGGEDNAGGKLKEAGNGHWFGPNIGADNSSGFTALPGGFRPEGDFGSINELAFFWSSTVGTSYPDIAAWSCLLESYNSHADMREPGKESGNSVRCVRDTPSATNSINDINTSRAPLKTSIFLNGLK